MDGSLSGASWPLGHQSGCLSLGLFWDTEVSRQAGAASRKVSENCPKSVGDPPPFRSEKRPKNEVRLPKIKVRQHLGGFSQKNHHLIFSVFFSYHFSCHFSERFSGQFSGHEASFFGTSQGPWRRLFFGSFLDLLRFAWHMDNLHMVPEWA